MGVRNYCFANASLVPPLDPPMITHDALDQAAQLLRLPGPAFPGHGTSLMGTPSVVRQGGHNWTHVQICSLEEPLVLIYGGY